MQFRIIFELTVYKLWFCRFETISPPSDPAALT